MSDRNYELELAMDYDHNKEWDWDGDLEREQQMIDEYEEHLYRLETEPIRYRIEIFMDRVVNTFNRRSLRRYALRVLPWHRDRKYEENIPF